MNSETMTKSDKYIYFLTPVIVGHMVGRVQREGYM